MVSLMFNASRVKSLNFSVNIEKDSQIEVEGSFDFNVIYQESLSKCSAILSYKLACKNNPQILTAYVSIEAQFSYNGNLTVEDKKAAHIQAYLMTFPIVQEKIKNMLVDAGLPPLYIEMAPLDIDSVKVQ